MPFLEHANLQFYFRQSGRGVPFFFQHGLGAEVSQPFGLFRPPPGARLIAMDCRGHGRSSLGPANSLRFRTFADDLRALMNYLGISRAIVGGISMGAGVALNFALRYPGNVLGLVLSRPAWLDKPNAFNVRMFSLIACLIKEHGPAAGLKRFRASSELAEIRSKYPDTAKSLESQFLRKRARETCPILEQIPNDRDVRRTDRILLHLAGLVERQVEESRIGARQSHHFDAREQNSIGLPFGSRPTAIPTVA